MNVFGSPWAFGVLLILGVRLLLLIRDRRGHHFAFHFSSVAIVKPEKSWALRLRWIPFTLEMAGLALMIVALARPQEVIALEQDRLGIDIAIVLDASGSMAAEDFSPRNRFSVAKELIDQFVARRLEDRIGIITFGSRAATRVPITFDRKIAREALALVEIGENGDGTAIGQALATGVNRLRSSEASSRVLILLTDGVNNAGSIDPATAAVLAEQSGIRVYTIGVGSHGPVPVPVRVQNRLSGQVETVYQLIRADLDEDMLMNIAARTGGEYFRATDESALQSVLATIDRLEKSRLDAPRAHSVAELYRRPLGIGLVLVAVSLLAGETRWMRLAA